MIRVIAGGYADAGARGLCPLAVEGARLVAGAPVAGAVNVSAGVRVPGTRRWFLVDERANRVTLRDAAADWREIASFASGGEGPCHLALDAAGTSFAVANYDSGSVALFRLDPETRAPLGPPAIHEGDGSGPDRDRQFGPHAHWIGFARDGRLHVADLGADRLLAFAIEGGRLGPAAITFAAPPGSGPRQLAFHPSAPVAYLVSELAATLTVLAPDTDGGWIARQTLPLLPDGVAPPGNLGGALALNAAGTRLYATNRGHDSVAAFALAADGATTPLGHAPSGGRSPRFLLVLEEALLVAHEQAGGVTLLPLGADGRPSPPVAAADAPGAAFLGILA